MSVTTTLAPSTRNSASSSSSGFVPVSRQNTVGSSDGAARSVRASKRYSVTALYLSMSAQDRDLEIEDELARGILLLVLSLPARLLSSVQKTLRDLKSKISSQSKKNFVLEKDVRYLDSRIALLIQNRMALEEVRVILFSISFFFFERGLGRVGRRGRREGRRTKVQEENEEGGKHGAGGRQAGRERRAGGRRAGGER